MAGDTLLIVAQRSTVRLTLGAVPVAGEGSIDQDDIDAAVTAHKAEADPHPTYTTAAELATALASYLTTAAAALAYQPLAAVLTLIAALVPAADRVPYFTGAASASLATLTAFGRSLVAAASATAARALLMVPEPLVLSSDATNSTTTYATIGNLAFVPEPGCTYLVQVWGVFSAAASTTGMEFLIDPGNGAGGGAFRTRGASSTAQASLYGALDAVNGAAGTSSAVNVGQKTGFEAFGIFVAHASAPTAASVKWKSEIGGSQVAIATGDAVMLYTKLR